METKKNADTEAPPIRTGPLIDEDGITGRARGAGVPWVTKRVDGKALSATITDHGHPMCEVRSSLQKCLRRGQEEEAAYWAFQLIRHGWVKYLWRTLRIVTSEDVGLGDPLLALQINALANNAKEGTNGFAKNKAMFIGHCEIHAIMLICRAEKDWRATHLMCKTIVEFAAINRGDILPREPRPEALDAHTQKGRAAKVPRSQWWLEEAALFPKSDGHSANDGDPYADVQGAPEPLE